MGLKQFRGPSWWMAQLGASGSIALSRRLRFGVCDGEHWSFVMKKSKAPSKLRLGGDSLVAGARTPSETFGLLPNPRCPLRLNLHLARFPAQIVAETAPRPFLGVCY